jgi:hypothetical protein
MRAWSQEPSLPGPSPRARGKGTARDAHEQHQHRPIAACALPTRCATHILPRPPTPGVCRAESCRHSARPRHPAGCVRGERGEGHRVEGLVDVLARGVGQEHLLGLTHLRPTGVTSHTIPHTPPADALHAAAAVATVSRTHQMHDFLHLIQPTVSSTAEKHPTELQSHNPQASPTTFPRT